MKKETEVLLNTNEGQLLQLKVNHPEKINTSTVCIMCHPHPLMGGTMDNKVVTTVIRAFEKMHYIGVRFNFRGIGKSTGTYDAGNGELEDLKHVVEYVRTTYMPLKLIIAGFSFGSFIAYSFASKYQCDGLITVAPPITNFDFQKKVPLELPWLLIQGLEDEVISSQAVLDWSKTNQENNLTVITYNDATHFFHGKLNNIIIDVTNFIHKN